MDAVGMQYLGGGIWCSLRYLAGTVVTSFCGEVNAAVNGSIRKHSSSFISLPRHWWQHICGEHRGMKQIIDAQEAWKYQGLRWKINVSFCTFAFQLRQVHEPTKGRWYTTNAKLSASVTGLPLVLHVSLPKTIFFFHTFNCESEVWNISLLKNVFNCSFYVRTNETVWASGKWWKGWIYKSQRKLSQQICSKTLKWMPKVSK